MCGAQSGPRLVRAAGAGLAVVERAGTCGRPRRPLLDRIGRGADLIGIEPVATVLVRLRAAESTGRPLGADDFLKLLERRLGRALRPRKPGPKPGAAAPGKQLDMEIAK